MENGFNHESKFGLTGFGGDFDKWYSDQFTGLDKLKEHFDRHGHVFLKNIKEMVNIDILAPSLPLS